MDILWIDLMKPVWKIWIDDHPKSCMAGFLCLSNPTADAVAEEKPAGSAVPVKCDLNDLNGYIIYHNIAAVVEAPYGSVSKPLYPCSSHQNSWDLWMFIPLKMVLIGIDPYPYSRSCRGSISQQTWGLLTWGGNQFP